MSNLQHLLLPAHIIFVSNYSADQMSLKDTRRNIYRQQSSHAICVGKSLVARMHQIFVLQILVKFFLLLYCEKRARKNRFCDLSCSFQMKNSVFWWWFSVVTQYHLNRVTVIFSLPYLGYTVSLLKITIEFSGHLLQCWDTLRMSIL